MSEQTVCDRHPEGKKRKDDKEKKDRRLRDGRWGGEGRGGREVRRAAETVFRAHRQHTFGSRKIEHSHRE